MQQQRTLKENLFRQKFARELGRDHELIDDLIDEGSSISNSRSKRKRQRK